MLTQRMIDEARFYGAFPDALGRATRALLVADKVEPPERDTSRSSFDRTQDPRRLADWANSLEQFEHDPHIGSAVRSVFKVVDGILVKG